MFRRRRRAPPGCLWCCVRRPCRAACRVCRHRWPAPTPAPHELDEDRPSRRPARPLASKPGSEERIRELQERVARGESTKDRRDYAEEFAKPAAAYNLDKGRRGIYPVRQKWIVKLRRGGKEYRRGPFLTRPEAERALDELLAWLERPNEPAPPRAHARRVGAA